MGQRGSRLHNTIVLVAHFTLMRMKDSSRHCKVPCVASIGMQVTQDQGVSLQHINNRKIMARNAAGQPSLQHIGEQHREHAFLLRPVIQSLTVGGSTCLEKQILSLFVGNTFPKQPNVILNPKIKTSNMKENTLNMFPVCKVLQWFSEWHPPT